MSLVSYLGLLTHQCESGPQEPWALLLSLKAVLLYLGLSSLPNACFCMEKLKILKDNHVTSSCLSAVLFNLIRFQSSTEHEV